MDNRRFPVWRERLKEDNESRIMVCKLSKEEWESRKEGNEDRMIVFKLRRGRRVGPRSNGLEAFWRIVAWNCLALGCGARYRWCCDEGVYGQVDRPHRHRRRTAAVRINDPPS